MESRNTRSYREFIQRTLHADEHQDMYDGVCFLSAHGGGVGYAQGSFTSSSSHHLNVDLHGDSSASTASLLDTRQFLRVFEQISTRALQQETRLHSQKSGSDQGEEPQDAPFTPAFHIGEEAFHVVFSSFTTVCAVASGRRHGLVVEKLPFGVLVVLFRQPHSAECVLPRRVRAGDERGGARPVHRALAVHDQGANTTERLLMNMGWEEDGGLGPTSAGRIEPVATVFKTDRAGVGVQPTAKLARVTHFPAHSEQQQRAASDGLSDAQRMQERLARKRKQDLEQKMPSQKERKARKLQDQQRDRALGREVYGSGLEGYEDYLQ